MYVRSVKDWFGIGLFRELFTGSVSNVKIEKGYLYINDSNTYAGGVIGNIVGNVKVENCSVDMAVCSEVTNGTDCVGGIVGWCQSGAVITECAFHGDISYRDSRGIFGGICGYASRSTIISCEEYLSTDSTCIPAIIFIYQYIACSQTIFDKTTIHFPCNLTHTGTAHHNP